MSLFDSINSIRSIYQKRITPDAGTNDDSPSPNGGHVDLVMTSQQFSCTNDVGVDNYYLFTLSGNVAMSLNGTLHSDYWTISIKPKNDKAILLDSSPATQLGSHQTTVGVSTSLSGSVGFFGLVGTGNIGMSKTESSSTTYTVPDVNVSNKSDIGEFVRAAAWKYEESEESATQNSDLNILTQMLFMVPRDQDTPYDAQSKNYFEVDVNIRLKLSDHDGHHGTRWWDTLFNEIAHCIPEGGKMEFDPGEDRSGSITFPTWLVQTLVPPPPKVD